MVLEVSRQTEREIRREMRRLKGELKALDKQSKFLRERRRRGHTIYILRKKFQVQEVLNV